MTHGLIDYELGVSIDYLVPIQTYFTSYIIILIASLTVITQRNL